ncbi:FHA domain-containing protein [Cystobacter fuscus]
MRDEITIGRQEGNTIRLTERNVSRRHARLLRQNGHVVVEDLGSYNGVRINGERIQGPAQVGDGDLIQIGDYDLAVQREVPQPIAPTIRVPASALQAAIAQAERRRRRGSRRAGGRQQKESEEDSDDTSEDTPSDAIGETTTVLPGRQRRQSTAVIRLDQVEMNRPRRLENVEPEDAPRLIVVGPEFKGQEFVCIRTEMRVGRTEDNDIAIDHRSLSRLHAKIVREDTGEWRIIDMQSANGMSVNGEIYAQASLSHGDIVELGHVKMRFVGPGENASGLVNDAAKGSKKGLVLTLAGLVLVGAAGGAAWFVFGQTPSSPEAPVAVAQPPRRRLRPHRPTPPRRPPSPWSTRPRRPPWPRARRSCSPSRTPSPSTTSTRPWPCSRRLAPAGSVPPGSRSCSSRPGPSRRRGRTWTRPCRTWRRASCRTPKGLAAAATTVAFASERTELKAKVDTALKAADKPTNTTRPAAGTAQQTSAATDSKALLEEGKTLLRQQKYQDAESYFRKCISVDPGNASCHMWMGTTVARLGNFEKGAQFYREFLRLAPNDPNAAKVKKLIDDYEKSLKPGGGK